MTMDIACDSDRCWRDYVEQGSEAAFAEVTRRYVALVYSAALRRCAGDAALAEEATQIVFTELARKARSLPREVVLAGWLYRHAGFVAATLVRGESRRRQREQTAMELQATRADDNWSHIAPELEEAMQALPGRDRDALVLRFLDRQPLARVGAVLGISGDAARMRVERALEKLRDLLARRGVTSTAAVLALALAEQGAVAVPASLAGAVSTAALAAVAASPMVGILGIMASTKLKAGIAIIALAGLTASVVLLELGNRKLRAETEELSRQLVAARAAGTRAEASGTVSGTTTRAMNDTEREELARLRGEHAELLRLRGQAGDLQRQLAEARQPATTAGATWRMGERRGPAELHNNGLATPQAAFETALWTALNQPEAFGKLIQLDPRITEGAERWTEAAPAFAAALAAQVNQAEKVWIADARNIETTVDGQSSGRITVLDLKLEPPPGGTLAHTSISMPFKFTGSNWAPVMLKDMRAIEPPGQGEAGSNVK